MRRMEQEVESGNLWLRAGSWAQCQLDLHENLSLKGSKPCVPWGSAEVAETMEAEQPIPDWGSAGAIGMMEAAQLSTGLGNAWDFLG